MESYVVSEVDRFEEEMRQLAARLSQSGISGPSCLVLYRALPVDLRDFLDTADETALAYWHGQAINTLAYNIRVKLMKENIVLPHEDIYQHLTHLSACNDDELIKWAERYIEHRYRD